MRIFQLNTFCGVKSTGRITTEIAKLVETSGGECKIGFGADMAPDELSRFAMRIGTPVERKAHGALRKLLDGEGYGSTLGTRRLIGQMRAFRPELVHLHNLHGCYLNLRLLFGYLKDAGLPVVWTLHDCWPFTGHCAYFDYAGCDRWQTRCHDCPQQRGYPVCIGLDGSARNFQHKKRLFTALSNLTFVVPCEWMKQPLGRSFLSGYPVRVIPNGVNREIFHPVENDVRARYSIGERKLVLAAASEWDERKGLRYLVESARRLGEGYRFAVIGLSEAQVEALPEGMTGLTHTESPAELAAWYSAADCFANPTMEDNMPMVNLEALACGTPVAVFRTGGCPEAVDGSCGAVVEQADVPAFSDAIARLCERRNEMREGCLRRAARFDSGDTFRAYVDLYKERLR